MPKSAEVCSMAIESLLDGHSVCRLWTFTVPDLRPPRDTARIWSLIQRDLVRSLRFQAVRVFEIHPGGHGLHVHAVTPFWYDVNSVREITSKHGFGRINVITIRADRASYVCKYLRKQASRQYRELSGLRLWACVGKGKRSAWRGVSCCNVVYDSESTRIWRTLYGYLDLTDRRSFKVMKSLTLISDLVTAGLAVVKISNPFTPFPKIRTVPLFPGVPVVSVGGCK